MADRNFIDELIVGGTNPTAGECVYPNQDPWGSVRPYWDFAKGIEGFVPQLPRNNTPVSKLPEAIRSGKQAFLSCVSVRAIFSSDVEDGDLVRPVAVDNSDIYLETVTQLADAVWVPVNRVEASETDEAGEPPVPAFWGIAYKNIGRVLLGPAVAHPKFRFKTGDTLYAATGGKLTTENTGMLVGFCLAPGKIYIGTSVSESAVSIKALQEKIADLSDSLGTLESKHNDDIKSLQSLIDDLEDSVVVIGGSVDDSTVVANGSTAERPLSDRFGDIINIKDFGAKGDGTADDQEAFDKAIESEVTSIYIPAGLYIINGLFIDRPINIFASDGATIKRKHWNRTYYADRGMYGNLLDDNPQARSGLITLFSGASGSIITGGTWDMNAWEHIEEYNVNDVKAIAELDPNYDFQCVIFSRSANDLKIENVTLRGATSRAFNIQNSNRSVFRNIRMLDSEGGFQISIGNYLTIENLYCERISNRIRHASDDAGWNTNSEYLLTYQHNSVFRQTNYSNIRGIIFNGYAPLEGTGTEPNPCMLTLERPEHSNISDIVMSGRVNVENVISVGLSMIGCDDVNVSNLDIHDHVLSIDAQGCVDCHIDKFHIDNNWYTGDYDSSCMGLQIGNGAWAQHGNDSGTDMFMAAQSRNVSVTNGEIHNAYVGVELQASNAHFQNVHVRGCYVGYNLREVDERGVHLDSLNNRFVNCSATYCGKCGVQIYSQGNVQLDGIILFGNGWDSSLAVTNRVGIYIGGNSEYCEVTNCRIFNEKSISKEKGFSFAPSTPETIKNGTNRYPYRFTFASPDPTQFQVGQAVEAAKLFNGEKLYCHVLKVLRDSITVGWTLGISKLEPQADQLVPITGSISNIGKSVTGINTRFQTEIVGTTYMKLGNDYCIVARVNSDSSLVLATSPSENYSNIPAYLVHVPVWMPNNYQQYGMYCGVTGNHAVLYKDNIEYDNAIAPMAITNEKAMCAESEYKKSSGAQELVGVTNAYLSVVQNYDIPKYWKLRILEDCTGIDSLTVDFQVGDSYTTLMEDVNVTAGTIVGGPLPNSPQGDSYYLRIVGKSASKETTTITAGKVYGYIKVHRLIPNECLI